MTTHTQNAAASPSESEDRHQLLSDLMQAIRINDAPKALELIERGADLKQISPGAHTPLIVAAIFHRDQLCEALIAAGSEVDVLDSEGQSPLHHACSQSSSTAGLRTCEVLLAHGADVNLATLHTGDTPLHLAAQENDPQLCALLLAKGAQIDCANTSEDSALAVAVKAQSEDAIKILLKAGADPNWWPDQPRKRSLVRQSEYLDDFQTMWTLMAYGATCAEDVEGDYGHIEPIEAAVRALDSERFSHLFAKHGEMSADKAAQLRQIAIETHGQKAQEIVALVDATLARCSIAHIAELAKRDQKATSP